MMHNILQWIDRAYARVDYGFFLPFIAKLPPSVGRPIAFCRGVVYGLFRRDWRAFCLGDDAIPMRLLQGYGKIRPELSRSALHLLLLKRYGYQSVEEWEGACIANGNSAGFRVRYEGLEAVQAYLAEHKKGLFLTGHFGSSILGITFLEKLGVPLLVMSSDVVDAPAVYPVVSRFFTKKYRGIDRYLHGGEVLHREGNLRRFMTFSKERGSIVIIGDLPASPQETPVWVDFFGETRGFAPGAVKLGESADMGIIPFVCTHERSGYVVTFGTPKGCPYAFLRDQIEVSPPLWWAADLLMALPVKPKES